jgi:hypothetical protein
MTGPPKDIALWLAVCTGCEMDKYGMIRVLDAAAWRERRREWKRMAPSFFQPAQRSLAGR